MLGMGSMDYNTSRYDGYDDSGDMRKVDVHLTQATNNLCRIFQVSYIMYSHLWSRVRALDCRSMGCRFVAWLMVILREL
jgi:hypothetical protein